VTEMTMVCQHDDAWKQRVHSGVGLRRTRHFWVSNL